ncbi:MAG: type II toxin-antitoxin system HicB family antitoxin [Candidatus Hydrogenedentota bacterium]
MNYKVTILVEKDEDGFFAYAPELEGCHTQGDTFEEAMENMKEAVEVYIESLPESRRPRLRDRQVISTSLEVTLA